MRFLIDAQLPPMLSDWIAAKGETAKHIQDFALFSSDETIWRLAIDREFVLITKDRDFAEWALTRSPKPQIVWIRLGNVTNESLVSRLDAAWLQISKDLGSGAQVVEVRRP